MADVKENRGKQEHGIQVSSEADEMAGYEKPLHEEELPEVEIIEMMDVEEDYHSPAKTENPVTGDQDERDTMIKNLRDGAKKSNKEKEDLRNEVLRARADYENLKKRNVRERFEEIKRAKKNLFISFLSVLDNFERALEVKEGQNFLQGIEMIHKQFVEVFSQNNVHEINAKGTPFNPHMHEAMVQQPTDAVEENTVVQVFQKGFSFNGELLRPAQVSVAVPMPETPLPSPNEAEETSSGQEQPTNE